MDAITYTNPVEIPKLAADPRFRVYHSPHGYLLRVIYWQNQHPFFRDRQVRRALTLGINRHELLRVLNLPETIPLIDGVYTLRQLRRGDLPEPLPYDPATARALLDAAGWRDEDGDGVRERNGEEFRSTAIVYAEREWQALAVYVQEQLRRVGVRMELQTLESSLMRERVRAGEFEAAISSTGSIPRTLGFYFGEMSPIGYSNPRVTSLVEGAKVTGDPDATDRFYRQLTEMFRADLPITRLFPQVETVFAHRRIQGLSSPYRTDPVWHMADLWLEEQH